MLVNAFRKIPLPTSMESPAGVNDTLEKRVVEVENENGRFAEIRVVDTQHPEDYLDLPDSSQLDLASMIRQGISPRVVNCEGLLSDISDGGHMVDNALQQLDAFESKKTSNETIKTE